MKTKMKQRRPAKQLVFSELATPSHIFFAVAIVSCLCFDTPSIVPRAHADIFRWDNGEPIPGTEGMEPGPGVQLEHRQLRFAELSNFDLTGANFEGADLSGSDFENSTLTGANLAGAFVANTRLREATSRGLTKEQLYSTASYQAQNLEGIELQMNDLSGWDFSGQDLTNANLFLSDLADADLTRAVVAGAELSGTTHGGFTKEQLYSTASYQTQNLQGIFLGPNDLTGWDFSGQNLLGATFGGADLTDANLTGANLVLSYFGPFIVIIDAITLSNTDLSEANLSNAHITLEGSDVSELTLTAAVYNQWTVFPDGFDPDAAGMIYVESSPGDFNVDGELNADDIRLFAQNWRRTDLFDLNRDLVVDHQDLQIWVHDLKNTWFGDANLDGEFNSTDLVEVFKTGEYEDGLIGNSSWATGDWNTDGEVDTGDLVVAFQDGGFEQGPRTANNAVPEPTAWTIIAFGIIGLTVNRRGSGQPTN